MVVGPIVILLLAAAWVARPWFEARRSVRRRKRSVRTWGEPAPEPPAGTEGEAATLRGQLEAGGTIEHLRGPACVAATLHGQPAGDAHLRAPGVRLRMGEASLPVDGCIEVLVGSAEEHLRSVADKTSYRFAEGTTRPSGADRLPRRAQLRRLRAGDEVVVRGWLERRTATGGQYREGAHDWALVAGPGGEPVQVAPVGATRARLQARHWALRALGIGILVFGLLPLGLDSLSEHLGDRGNETLRDCDEGGHSWITAGHWVAWLRGQIPFYAGSSRDRQRRLLGHAVNGIRVCVDRHPAPVDWVEALVELARERLPPLRGVPYADAARASLEETLHEAGLDRAIVELQGDLWAGGNVTERVRAHLYLGDLEGAIATLEEPGAEVSPHASRGLQPGVLLCMAGRYDEAFELFGARLRATESDPSSHDHDDTVVRNALCALRAGDPDRAEPPRPLRWDAVQSFLAAHIAAARGWPAEDPRWEAISSPNEATSLVIAAALAEAGAWSRLLEALDRHALGRRLRYSRLGSRIFNTNFNPVLDTRRLVFLAERLEAGAAEPDAAAPLEAEQLRAYAGHAYRYLALLYGRRWDPRAESALDDAERLLGADDVAPLREALAFFHGDWERTKESGDAAIRNLSRIYMGEAPEAGFDVDGRRDLHLALLNPSEYAAERAIAELYLGESEVTTTPEGRWQQLRVQALTSSWAEIFYRLTLVIAHGENLGLDVSAQRAQLDALRALVSAQPEPYLFMGPSGDTEI